VNRTGWAVALGSVVIGALGFAMSMAELVIAGVTGAAVCAYAWGATRGRVAVRVEREILPDRVSVGEPASLVVAVTNEAPRVSPAAIARQQTGQGVRQYQIAPLAPGERDQQMLPLDTTRRGVYPIAPTEIAQVDPLVLAGGAQPYGDSLRLVVHPTVHRVAAVTAVSRQDVEGVQSDQWAHGSESFHALREYNSGDDHRLIHWKSSARAAELVVKQFVDLWTPELLVVLDTMDAHYDVDHFEAAVSVAASVAVASVARRHATTIVLGSGRSVSVQPGRGHERELLDLLAAADPAGDARSLVDLAARTSTGRRDRVLVLVTGNAPGEQLLAFLRANSTYQRRVVVRMKPGLEGSPIVEVSRSGDEAVAASSVDDFVTGWSRLHR
jgi:uncharacterized protein (DUF58 family)